MRFGRGGVHSLSFKRALRRRVRDFRGDAHSCGWEIRRFGGLRSGTAEEKGGDLLAPEFEAGEDGFLALGVFRREDHLLLGQGSPLLVCGTSPWTAERFLKVDLSAEMGAGAPCAVQSDGIAADLFEIANALVDALPQILSKKRNLNPSR